MPPAYPDSPESGCAVVATVTKLFGFPKRCLKGVLAGGSWSATHHGWSGHSRWADGWSTTKQVSPAKKEGQCEGQVRQLRAGDCGWRSLAFSFTHANTRGFFDGAEEESRSKGKMREVGCKEWEWARQFPCQGFAEAPRNDAPRVELRPDSVESRLLRLLKL